MDSSRSSTSQDGPRATCLVVAATVRWWNGNGPATLYGGEMMPPLRSGQNLGLFIRIVLVVLFGLPAIIVIAFFCCALCVGASGSKINSPLSIFEGLQTLRIRFEIQDPLDEFESVPFLSQVTGYLIFKRMTNI